ncbi:hypothetical protein GMA12_11855 [Kocuria sediminis]|uniref:Uncharacterized protein n=1 Tax=Kocuria sediminis TaxID=1038857 RepID=A0A6N8GSL2_9MICC|nr:hypothetical protein [Kocuria sediminis]MUN63824.1 hypothetical protein [Kocuria sediminis]
MKLSKDARRFLRLPLLVITLGAVIGAGAWIWNIASCCEGGANIGAGALFAIGLAMLAGGFLWALLIVLVGIQRKK